MSLVRRFVRVAALDLQKQDTRELNGRWRFGEGDLPPGALYAVASLCADRLLEKHGDSVRDLLCSTVEDLGL